MAQAEQVAHPLAPVYDKNSKVLILGTMPSPASRKVGFYYMHPQNRFWKVICTILNEPLPDTVEEKRDLLLRRGIALWDTLASCEIEGAADAAIKCPVPNDFGPILETASLRAVFTTGKKAYQLYTKHCAETCGKKTKAGYPGHFYRPEKERNAACRKAGGGTYSWVCAFTD